MAVDTALQRCSVIITDGDRILSEKMVGMEKGHAEHLAPMAADALAEAGCGVADLDRVGVVVGPGGFTGVRIALAFARGLAVGRALSVVGVSSLAALAAGVDDAPPNAFIAPVVDARRGQLYAALYDRQGAECIAPFVATPEDVIARIGEAATGGPVMIVGTGSEIIGLRTEWRTSNAADQIEIKTVARLTIAAAAPQGPPAPIYLRPPDAKPPKPGLFAALQK